MHKLVFGKDNQLSFSSDKEKYYSIGFICNSKNAIITNEDNEKRGSYTDARRLRIKNTLNISAGLKNALRDSNRINCNEFVDYLISEHNFKCYDDVHITSNFQDVIQTIPEEYVDSFKEGYEANN